MEGGSSFSIPPSGYLVLNTSSSNNILFIKPIFFPGKEFTGLPASDLRLGLLD